MRKVAARAVIAVVVLLTATAAAVLLVGNDIVRDRNDAGHDGADRAADNLARDGTNASIVLGTTVTVDGLAIATDASSPVYLSTSSLGYSIINIARAGTYILNGSADDTQVRVIAGSDDEVVLVLNRTTISCGTAPAILVHSAFEPGATNRSGVTIWLPEGTSSSIRGSHSEENSGALSSNVSLLIDGSGALEIAADMEGVETKKHMTINGGSIAIVSDEDAINANEEGVSVIAINGGAVYADASGGLDGDGIDSNGHIVIGGGLFYGFASGENSGTDSDLGTVINGGTVFATGNTNDKLSASSDQPYLTFSFPSFLAKDTLVYVLDGKGDPVLAFRTRNSCSVFVYSSPDLVEGEHYAVHTGGDVDGTFDAYGLSTSFTVTAPGTQEASGPGGP